MTLALVFSLLVAQPASCTPVSRNATLDVSFKKGARVKDVVAWLSKVNCAEYDVWPGLETNALTLVVEGKIRGSGIESLAAALLESGGARLERVRLAGRIRKRLTACDPVEARAALASARSKKGGCQLDLTRFGDPMTFGDCLDAGVNLGPKDEAGRFPVEHLGPDALLRAIGVEEHDLLVEPMPEAPDRQTAGASSPFSVSLVRGDKAMTLECSIVGDGESLALHPANALRAEARDACAIPESAITPRGDVMEVSWSSITPECLARAARFVPAARDGGFSVKLYAIRRNTFFGFLGFANGDEVRMVNGAPLSGTPDELLARLKGQKRFVVELVRRGEPKTITVVLTGK